MIWFLRPAVDGIAPQYPVGTAVLGAAIFPIFGIKSLIYINILSGIGTLVATYFLALRLFASKSVGLLATALLAIFSFWAEYVFGHWPHSVSVFCTTLAVLSFLRAMPRETAAFGPAVLSGLVIGIGMLFRIDGILLVPGIAILTILWAARPVVVLAGGAVGIVPMVGLLAATNHAKFGTWNPLSYGDAGGGTDVTNHIGTIGVMLVAVAGLALLRILPPAGRRVRMAIGLAALAGVGLLLLSPQSPYLWKLLRGTWAILFDATAINDPRPGVFRQPDGTLSFWGLPKKALFQSLPWLGLLGYFLGAATGPVRRSMTMVLVLATVWALPFLVLSWHGGLGSNMRYLLPLLPGLCALAAWAMVDLAGRYGGGSSLVRYGVLAVVAMTLVVGRVAPEAEWRVQQVYSTWLFLATLALALAAGLHKAQWLTKMTLVVSGAALGLGLHFAISDLQTSQVVRFRNEARARAVEDIPGPVIFYGAPEHFASAIGQPDRLLALPPASIGRKPIDPALFAAACDRGVRLVIGVGAARDAGLTADRLVALEVDGMTGIDRLYEIRCE